MNRCMQLGLVLLSLVLLALTGCQSGRADTTGQKSDGFPAPSQDLVYQAAVRTIIEQGFAPDYDESSERSGVLKSRWKTQLGPFSGSGTRERVTITVSEVPSHQSYYRVETNVIREHNVNIKNPSDPVFAEWENPTRLAEMENLITRRIEMSFLPGTASPEWRAGQGFDSRSPRLDNLDPPPQKKKDGPLGLGPLDLPPIK